MIQVQCFYLPNLEQVVGQVDAEIEQQDPEDAIGAPALRLLILGNLQLRHQA